MASIEEKQSPSIDEPPYIVEKYPGKVCCFCNLGERSTLGQGEFLRLEVNGDLGTIAESPNDEQLSPEENSKNNIFGSGGIRRQKNAKGKNFTHNDCYNELDRVGLLESSTLNALLDGKYLYVHQMCAMWSFGLNWNPNDSLNNIEAAVVKCLKCKCSYCGLYGASLACRMSCEKFFHLPCAAASGCFLIYENLTIFCSDHLSQVPLMCTDVNIDCRHCAELGDVSKLIMCSTCGDHYHTTCIGLANLPDSRSGWNCSQCSKCQICRQSDGVDGRSVKCEQCQKVYHSTCFRPIISSIPKYGWKCNHCRVCTDCGSRTPGAGTSSRWHCHYTICDSCYQQRNKGFSCPICHKAYRASAYKEMVKCSTCHRFVHSSCDSEADINEYHRKKENNPDYDYICPHCKAMPNSERAFIMAAQNRAMNDFSDFPSGSLSPKDIKDSDLESSEKSYMDYSSSADGKGFDTSKTSRKRMYLKDIHRSRSGKVIFPKNGVFGAIPRKRSNRGKNRHMFMSGYGALGGDRGTNRNMDDDITNEKKLILCSAKDKFILSQDICATCGSVGMDAEGCLIACAQCGQCYHPYCANVKVSKVMLQRGWRCLDCTVCEGCGQKNDEARLILCDECDISYHIYCMNPPLDTVPQGNWKCKWCVICQKCGSKSPGKNSSWCNSFLECGPCASQATCCVCMQQYLDSELIIQCRNCERWLHCMCDSINSEEEAQLADSKDYRCLLCRPKDKNQTINPFVGKGEKAGNESSPKDSGHFNFYGNGKAGLDRSATGSDMADDMESTHWIDGVYLNERGLNMIKSLTTEIKRKRKLRPPNEGQTKDSGISATIESVVAGSLNDMMCDDGGDGEFHPSTPIKSENYKDGMVWAGAEGPPEGYFVSTNDEGISILRKKRQRNLQKLGIGGFSVRNRGLKKETEENVIITLKKKIARKKPKSKLNETYPIYLQEAFFGKGLLEVKELKHFSDSDFIEYNDDVDFHRPKSEPTVKKESQKIEPEAVRNFKMNESSPSLYENAKAVVETEEKQRQAQEPPETSDENTIRAFPIPIYQNNLTSTITSDSVKPAAPPLIEPKSEIVDNPSNIEAVSMEEILSQSSASTSTAAAAAAAASVTNASASFKSSLKGLELKLDNGNMNSSVLSSPSPMNISPHPNMQQMAVNMPNAVTVTHSPQKKKFYQPVPQQVNIMLSNQNQHLQLTQKPLDTSTTALPYKNLNVQQQPQQQQQPPPLTTLTTPNQNLIEQDQHQQQQFAQVRTNTAYPTKMILTPQMHEEPMESILAGTQKTAEKMRRDEELGKMATISAVLYANTQHPELKQIYPIWNDRCKQILKRWRSLSTEKKAPFLQIAKDNRSALRIRKAQQDQEKLCFQQKTLKEQEQEKIWKQHQAKIKEMQTGIFNDGSKVYNIEAPPPCPIDGRQTLIHRPQVISTEKCTGMYVQTMNDDMAMPRVKVLMGQPTYIQQKCVPSPAPPQSPVNVVNAADKQLRSLLQKQSQTTTTTGSTSAAGSPTTTCLLLQNRNSLPLVKDDVTMKMTPPDGNRNDHHLDPATIKKNNDSDMRQDNNQYGAVSKRDCRGQLEPADTVPVSNVELEKLDQDVNVGNFGDILRGLGDGDDDEFLKSLTADDFNILEYADPELDELPSQNLLNKLDFEDTDKNTHL